jgi:hypothetical protein
MDLATFGLFAGLQFVSYLNLTINFRAIAHKRYLYACMSDGIACLLSWTIVRQISHAENTWEGMVGLMCGGMLAAGVGIWITRHWDT